MCCDKARQELLERTLEGRTISPGSPLGQHLQNCPECRSFRARLIEVDAALLAMPLEQAPTPAIQHILEQITPKDSPILEEKFLPWPVWLPAASLLIGLFWAYLALAWQRGPSLSGPVDSMLTSWQVMLQQWLTSHQDILSVVTLSVAIGILATVLGIALGLYVGREQATAG